mmetsp:Transcript_29140/g.59838  ORF Transcript_29140/g.59838 Transcript_29140/m.59838 type:complete len:709 (+) Transcript_29140:132-2258(+)
MNNSTDNPRPRSSPMLVTSLPMRSLPHSLEGVNGSMATIGAPSREQHPMCPTPPQMQPTPPAGAQAPQWCSRGRVYDDNAVITEHSDLHVVPEHLPFSINVKLPKIEDVGDNNDAWCPSAQEFHVIKSCWPGSANELSKSASIAEFTRYVVETLCCGNPEFVRSVLSLKCGEESHEEWQKRVERKSMEALFIYGTSSHADDGKILSRKVSMAPYPNNVNNSKDTSEENHQKTENKKETNLFRTKPKPIVTFKISDTNFFPKKPLPSRENAYQILSSHYKLGFMLKEQSASSGEQQLSEEGVSLILWAEVACMSPSFELPRFLRGENGTGNSASYTKHDHRLLNFYYSLTKNDKRKWKKHLAHPDGLSLQDDKDCLGLNTAIPMNIPFAVKLILPLELQQLYGTKTPIFANAESNWTGDPNNASSKANISEFTRSIVEDLFCEHPAFATTIVNTKGDNESYVEWIKRQSFKSSNHITFVYGTAGNGMNRRVLASKVTGNMLDYAKENDESEDNYSEGLHYAEVVINFSLSNANFRPGVRIPSNANAYELLSCYYRLQKSNWGPSEVKSDDKVQLLLHIDYGCAPYRVPTSLSGAKRKEQNENRESHDYSDVDCDRIIELSYARTYKKLKNSPCRKEGILNGENHGKASSKRSEESPDGSLTNNGTKEKSPDPLLFVPKHSKTESGTKTDFAASVLLSLGTNSNVTNSKD